MFKTPKSFPQGVDNSVENFEDKRTENREAKKNQNRKIPIIAKLFEIYSNL